MKMVTKTGEKEDCDSQEQGTLRTILPSFPECFPFLLHAVLRHRALLGVCGLPSCGRSESQQDDVWSIWFIQIHQF